MSVCTRVLSLTHSPTEVHTASDVDTGLLLLLQCAHEKTCLRVPDGKLEKTTVEAREFVHVKQITCGTVCDLGLPSYTNIGYIIAA